MQIAIAKDEAPGWTHICLQYLACRIYDIWLIDIPRYPNNLSTASLSHPSTVHNWRAKPFSCMQD